MLAYVLFRHRRKHFDQPLNKEKKKASIASLNSHFREIGTAASSLCPCCASYMQQMAPDIKTSHPVEQQHIVRKLQKYGTSISYSRPTDKNPYELSILSFSNISKSDYHGQIGVIAGLLVGQLENYFIFHCTSYISHKSKRPIRSTPAAEILACSESLDDARVVSKVCSELLNKKFDIRILEDSKDLFTSLSTQTQRNSIDRSIHGALAMIRFEFRHRMSLKFLRFLKRLI